MKPIKKTVTIENPHWTASELRLYADMKDAEGAASLISERFTNAVNAGKGFKWAWGKLERTLYALAAFGAADTEPFHKMTRAMVEVYGDEAEKFFY